MLIPRLVFGCGHLTGGASRGGSMRLLERARAAGVLHFDTAPSYGIGTAEALVGQVLGSDRNVMITGKVGSERPNNAILRTVARELIRGLRGGPRKASHYTPAIAGDSRPAEGNFSPENMARSLEVSLGRLRRPYLDYLLLHESYAAPPAPEVVQFLDWARAEGKAKEVGVANGALYDPALRRACSPSWVMQAAIDPAMLLGPFPLPQGSTILHTVIKTHAWLKAIDLRYAAAVEATLVAFSSLAPRTSLQVLIPYYAAVSNVPQAKLIYTSSLADRLNGVLGAASSIDSIGAGGDIASHLAMAYTGDSRDGETANM